VHKPQSCENLKPHTTAETGKMCQVCDSQPSSEFLYHVRITITGGSREEMYTCKSRFGANVLMSISETFQHISEEPVFCVVQVTHVSFSRKGLHPRTSISYKQFPLAEAKKSTSSFIRPFIVRYGTMNLMKVFID
jgi:hypothetical protein